MSPTTGLAGGVILVVLRTPPPTMLPVTVKSAPMVAEPVIPRPVMPDNAPFCIVRPPITAREPVAVMLPLLTVNPYAVKFPLVLVNPPALKN